LSGAAYVRCSDATFYDLLNVMNQGTLTHLLVLYLGAAATFAPLGHARLPTGYGPAASMMSFAAAGQLAESGTTTMSVAVQLPVALGTGPQSQFSMVKLWNDARST
jgi:hypothetical protein